MRDKEFLVAMETLAPPLNRKFQKAIRKAGVRDDIENLKKDLIQLTILGALINSRLPIHKSVSCEQLIKTKACNVWAEYYATIQNSFEHARHEQIDLTWEEDGDFWRQYDIRERYKHLEAAIPDKLSAILQMKLEGYKAREIAESLNTTEDAINAHIRRLKEKVRPKK